MVSNCLKYKALENLCVKPYKILHWELHEEDTSNLTTTEKMFIMHVQVAQLINLEKIKRNRDSYFRLKIIQLKKILLCM